METLAVQSMMKLYENMSFDDSKRFKQLICSNDMIFRISNRSYNEKYYLIAENEKDARKTFMNTYMILQDIEDVWDGICRICGDDSIEEEDVKDHLQSHTLYEMMKFMKDKLESNYRIQCFDKDEEYEYVNMLDKLEINHFSLEKDKDPLFIFKGRRRIHIRSKTKENAIDKVVNDETLRKQILGTKDIYRIHNIYHCKTGLCKENKHKDPSFQLCNECSQRIICFICDAVVIPKQFKYRGNDGMFYLPHSHFAKKHTNDLDNEMLKKYIRENITIKLKETLEYDEKLQQIIEERNKASYKKDSRILSKAVPQAAFQVIENENEQVKDGLLGKIKALSNKKPL